MNAVGCSTVTPTYTATPSPSPTSTIWNSAIITTSTGTLTIPYPSANHYIILAYKNGGNPLTASIFLYSISNTSFTLIAKDGYGHPVDCHIINQPVLWRAIPKLD
jgi:hypothetical protein